MSASAGRILIIPKGNYNSSVTYEMLDLVYHNGKSWLAKKTVVGIEPSEANGEYWHNLVDLNIVNNLEATEEGGVLDARQGKFLNSKIDNLNSTVMLLSTANDFSAWTVLTLNESYQSFKFVFMELKDENDCLVDSILIPATVFANYYTSESNILLTGGNAWATVITQSPTTITVAKMGGKLAIWGVGNIS